MNAHVHVFLGNDGESVSRATVSRSASAAAASMNEVFLFMK